MTVYVDILFVINFFITYLLLIFTAFLLKVKAVTFRVLSACCVGALYSMTIFIDGADFFVSFIGKLLASIIIVLIAFGFKRLSVFLKSLLIFYFSNFLFFGIIAGVQLVTKTNAIKLKGGVAYFDISAATLILSAAAAYTVSLGIIKLYNKKISHKEIYRLKIYKNEEEYSLYAFHDSGNRLYEPFSGYPVIIADKDKIPLEGDRIIPYNTVGGNGMLKAFKPDRIEIFFGENKIESDRVYVALSEVKSSDFSAILNEEIIRGVS